MDYLFLSEVLEGSRSDKKAAAVECVFGGGHVFGIRAQQKRYGCHIL